MGVTRRLVVLLGGARPEVVVVDAVAQRVLRREPLAGTAMGVAVAEGRVLTLLARRDGIGPVQLAVIGGDGSVRTVAIPSIAAGVTAPSTPTGVVHFASPGLAARGSRAVVVGPESLVEVDLETLATREQRLDTRTTARASKIVVGWGRSAVWLQSGTIAYTGWSVDDAHTRTTTGVRIAAVGTGATRLLDSRATAIQRAGSTLLVHGGGPSCLPARRHAPLRAAREDGHRLCPGRGRLRLRRSGNSTRFGVVDLRSGRIVGLARTAKPTVVLTP